MKEFDSKTFFAGNIGATIDIDALECQESDNNYYNSGNGSDLCPCGKLIVLYVSGVRCEEFYDGTSFWTVLHSPKSQNWEVGEWNVFDVHMENIDDTNYTCDISDLSGHK